MADNSVILSTGSTAILCAYVLQWLKHTKWIPWVSVDAGSEWANRIMAAIFAAVASFGIHYNFDATAGTLTLTGITLAGIGHGLWQFITQFAIQHGAYKSFIVPVELAVKNGQLQQEVLGYLKEVAAAQKG